MRALRYNSAWILLMAAIVALTGCVNTSVKRVESTPAEHAEQEIPDAELLNVNIAVFDSGVPDNPQAREEAVLFPEVRRAEARYMPVNLRRTLQDTGYWGAVRVVPEPIKHSELLVTGEIIYSNGLTLELAIRAEDASGRVWLDKVYSGEAAGFSYDASRGDQDPFQGVYNRIADDLLAARRDLAVAELREIRRLSSMRFATDLAPQTFDRYIAKSGERYRLEGLPARDDPAMQRVERIRERDYAVVDALDKHYRSYQQQIDPAYNEWRSASYREAENLRELRQSAFTRKLLGAATVLAGIFGLTQAESAGAGAASQVAIFGGAAIFSSGLDKGRESKIHAQALQELGRSLESDVEPRTVNLANQTVTLSGSAEAQYEEWRRLLREIHAAETGFPTGDGDSESSRTGDR